MMLLGQTMRKQVRHAGGASWIRTGLKGMNPMEKTIIRLEKKEDWRETENLIREAFWNVYRPGCSEHYVMHVLRDDPAFIPELDYETGRRHDALQNH